MNTWYNESEKCGACGREGEGIAMYQPKPIDTSDIVLPEELSELMERMAENVHEVWARGRIDEGWSHGPRRNDTLRQTPCLVPYAALSEEEKEYDRRTAAETLKMILSMGYRITK